jgi:hypothetical protein
MRVPAGDNVVNTPEHDREGTPEITISSRHSDATAHADVFHRASRAHGRFRSRDLTRVVMGAIKAGLPVQFIEIVLDNCKIRLQVKDSEVLKNDASDSNDWADAK